MSDDLQELCEGFLHVEKTPEANMAEFCLCRQTCARKTVSCCALIFNAEKACVFKHIYRNQKIGRKVVHAEQLALQDANFLRCIGALHRIQFFLTYNPCHFSGGHNGFIKKISCTNSILEFYARNAHLNIGIEIVISYPYRAHWRTQSCSCNLQTELAPPCYLHSILLARKGIALLKDRGIAIRSFCAQDYDLLMRQFFPQLLPLFETHRARILDRRALCDLFTAKVIDDCRPESDEMQCSFCSEA